MHRKTLKQLGTVSRLGSALLVMIMIGACRTMPVADKADGAIFRWDGLNFAGSMENGRFDNGFGTLTVSPSGLEHRGFRVLNLSWDRIRSIRLNQLENLITLDLLKDKEHGELTTLVGYSRYQFEVIYGHLERLHRRFVKKAPSAEAKGSA
jgi:hypothetical protein